VKTNKIEKLEIPAELKQKAIRRAHRELDLERGRTVQPTVQQSKKAYKRDKYKNYLDVDDDMD
jgi:hypothetical protein